MRIFILLSGLLGTSMCLTSCAPMLAFAGYGGSVLQVAAQIERVKLVGDGVSYVGSGKTITDHALSMVTGADCRVFNVVSPDPICATKTAAVANVTVTLAPAIEPLPQTALQTVLAIDTENAAPAPTPSAGGE